MSRIDAEITRMLRARENDARSNPAVSQVVTYGGRDTSAGYRTVITGDGGLGYRTYLSNALPETVPELSIDGRLGLPGILSGKPA
jgi:hypothetical protein